MTALNKQARHVQRYTNYGVDMMEWDDGTYVKYSDYLALLDELEAAEKRIAELEAKLANPVLLPKTNGYWNEQEKAYEDAITLARRQIRLAGFRCEGDE
ncbi:TPA: hypothetical protein ACTYXS_001421 [Citrobacter freundii]